jgi:Trk K+ transport system NAD-binding subunit
VIAVGDDDRTTTRIDPHRRLDEDDRLTLVGSDDAVQEFLKRFDVTPTGAA